MTDLIKPGDLVMVFRPTPCCGNIAAIGTVGVVKKVFHNALGQCFYCQKLRQTTSDCLVDGYGYDTYRLKKIDPPALDESVERVRKLEHA